MDHPGSLDAEIQKEITYIQRTHSRYSRDFVYTLIFQKLNGKYKAEDIERNALVIIDKEVEEPPLSPYNKWQVIPYYRKFFKENPAHTIVVKRMVLVFGIFWGILLILNKIF